MLSMDYLKEAHSSERVLMTEPRAPWISSAGLWRGVEPVLLSFGAVLFPVIRTSTRPPLGTGSDPSQGGETNAPGYMVIRCWHSTQISFPYYARYYATVGRSETKGSHNS